MEIKNKALDITFIQMVRILAKQSKCQSKQVACLLVKDNRIVSTGINGSPAGFKNCCDMKFSETDWRAQHHEWSNTYEIHAEVNSVLAAARRGLSIDGCTAYCTLQPCQSCSKMLIASGIVRVVFDNYYDKADKKSEDFFKECGIKLEKI